MNSRISYLIVKYSQRRLRICPTPRILHASYSFIIIWTNLPLLPLNTNKHLFTPSATHGLTVLPSISCENSQIAGPSTVFMALTRPSLDVTTKMLYIFYVDHSRNVFNTLILKPMNQLQFIFAFLPFQLKNVSFNCFI